LPLKGAFVKTDRQKLFAILTNLVKNAIKFSEKGFVQLSLPKKDKKLDFYVKGSGMGSNENILEAILNDLFRLIFVIKKPYKEQV
jgi:signal transduction histidine kinase